MKKIKESIEKTKIFFKKNGYFLIGKNLKNLDKIKNKYLAMIAPISNEEKQTILESVSIQSKTKYYLK